MTAYTTSVDKDRLFNTVYSYTTSRYFEEDDTSLYDNMLKVAFALLEVADMRNDTYTDGIEGECATAVDYAYNQYKKNDCNDGYIGSFIDSIKSNNDKTHPYVSYVPVSLNLPEESVRSYYDCIDAMKEDGAVEVALYVVDGELTYTVR